MKGKVWPGECYFPDYTRPEVREWWSGLFQELIEDLGVKGVWNDMDPRDLRQREPPTHRAEKESNQQRPRPCRPLMSMCDHPFIPPFYCDHLIAIPIGVTIQKPLVLSQCWRHIL